MMAKDPAFLFYSSDFLTGTMFLADDQVGKYIKLLCAQHQKGHLSEKDMLNICKTYDKDIFEKFAKDENGLFYNKRLEVETIKRRDYSESRRNNRKKKDMNNISISYVKHMENENENENRIINKDLNTSTVKKEKVSNFVPPSIEEVNEFCKERKNEVNAEKFVNFYQAKGWVIGKTKMKDWKACVRTWEEKDKVQETAKKKVSKMEIPEEERIAHQLEELSAQLELERSVGNG